MKIIRLTLVFGFLSFSVFAQDFEIPNNYKLEKGDDFDRYEKDIINCVNWLAKTPINEQTEKRKASNAFLFKWISGSSKVHIEIKPQIVTFMDNGDLFMLFMGSWTKYSLESNDFTDKIKGITAGIELVMDFYQRNRGQMSKNKGVEKYVKMKEKKTLKEYIEKNG